MPEVTLFSPVKLGSLELRNRMVMAPMTRSRASQGGVPNALMAEYYAQRAGAGLIVTEGVSPSPSCARAGRTWSPSAGPSSPTPTS